MDKVGANGSQKVRQSVLSSIAYLGGRLMKRTARSYQTASIGGFCCNVGSGAD
jgi:hypothetical protein